MRKRFSDEHIISIIRAEARVSARELCRKHAIPDATFYTWHKKYDGMELLAEAMLDNKALQMAIGRKY